MWGGGHEVPAPSDLKVAETELNVSVTVVPREQRVEVQEDSMVPAGEGGHQLGCTRPNVEVWGPAAWVPLRGGGREQLHPGFWRP